MQGIYLWAMFQAITLGLILTRKWNSELGAVRFLSYFFVLSGLEILFQYLLKSTSFAVHNAGWVFTYEVFNYLYGPLLFFYLKKSNSIAIQRKEYLYFLPAAIFFVVFLATEPVFSEGYSYSPWIRSSFRKVNLFVITAFNIFFAFKCLQQRNSRDVGSDENWARWVFYITLFLSIKAFHSVWSVIFSELMFMGLDENAREYAHSLNDIFYAILNGVIIVLGQITLFSNPSLFSIPEILKRKPSTKSLDDKTEKEISQKLQEYVVDGRVFLKNNINERLLSEEIEVPVHVLSRYLNEVLEKSFTDYINELRIEEAKKLLCDPDTRENTLYSIALDSGFKSESAFYSNFKKFTNMTPRQYKIEHDME